MRKRFEQQISLGQLPIEATYINPKHRYALDELMAALKAIYCNREYNAAIFSILEKHINSGKKNTGRPGMDLWCIFVLAQVRLCLDMSYEGLHHNANNNHVMRRLMGVERDFGYERIEFEYQQIYDNVSQLGDDLISELNRVILEFGYGHVFKKKGNTALHLKTDSFVVESNVHFPTDYNLLWDCARKCLDVMLKLSKKYNSLKGWRKIGYWRAEIKGLMRELGKASAGGGKNKHDKVVVAAENYLDKARLLLEKLRREVPGLPIADEQDLCLVLTIEYFMILMGKHIDLVERRILKGEKIPHSEKMFSIFETYTEWITKGKMNPGVELGKKLSITTDRFGLIVDYHLMDGQQDRDIVIELADRILAKYRIFSWSFDKGFWNKENKALLQLEIPQVVMPKLGHRNQQEESEERSPQFKRLKNKHSAIESNINELENRGLDRCPDRGIHHYKRYIGLGVSAYNLKKIGREILRQEREALQADLKKMRA